MRAYVRKCVCVWVGGGRARERERVEGGVGFAKRETESDSIA